MCNKLFKMIQNFKYVRTVATSRNDSDACCYSVKKFVITYVYMFKTLQTEIYSIIQLTVAVVWCSLLF